MSDEELHDAAVAYARMGWAVFPLEERDKSPATKHGFLDATTEVGAIDAVWRDYPSCNIGVSCGQASGGLVALDFDVDYDKGYDSTEWLEEWEREHGKLPETASAVTGRGGTHLFYRVDREIKKSENPELHIDIRGDGSYVMVAPSIHPNGNRVFWDLSPDDVGIAEADDNVYALIDAVRPPKEESEEFTIPEDGKVKEGARNRFIYRMACSLRAKSFPEDTIKATCVSYNMNHCDPPLTDDEIMKPINSALKHKPGTSKQNGTAKPGATSASHNQKFSHSAVARQLMEERGACLLGAEEPAIRDANGRWRIGWDAYDRAIIDIHDDCTIHQRKEVKAYIKAYAERRSQAPWNLIAFKNGVLDVRTLELRDMTPDDIIPNIIPHNWNSDAQYDLLDKTIDKFANGDTSVALNLSEFMGLAMLRNVVLFPFFPVLIGGGSNGKSTYISMLRRLIGDENACFMQPHEIASHFMGVHVAGKLVNLGDDIPGDFLNHKDCSVIKKIATGDPLFTDVKGGVGYHFTPYATMVFSCNKFPRLEDTSDGFMRRLFPIAFNAKFSPMDKDFDPDIGSKIATEEAMERACVLAVDGIQRFLESNRPTSNRMSELLKTNIRIDNSTALQWIQDENLTAEWFIGKTKPEAYAAYEEWAIANGFRNTKLASKELAAQVGATFQLKCDGSGHRDVGLDRKTVRVFRKTD